MNRQIRKDNALLRELKALVNKLSEAVENTATKIAEKLENIRNTMITLKYKFLFNKKQIKQVDFEKQSTPPLIKRYRNVKDEIKRKTAEYKRLKSEKDACSPLNIFKQNQLSKQLATLTEEIEELKSDKNFLLSKLGCKTESDITQVEKNHKHNIDVADKLKDYNVDLQAEYKTEKSSYIEIKNNIPPENIEAVQEERTLIQTDGIHQMRIALEQTYKEKFDDDIFMEAQNIVNSDLCEKPLRQSVIKRLKREREKSEATQYNTKKKEHDFEI